MKDPSPPVGRGETGFSLVELLTVTAIIGIMAAVAVPALANYLRLYRIRGAAQQVAGEIQTARLKAVSNNVYYGVVFVVLSPTTYRYVIEDNFVAGNYTLAAPPPVSVQLTNAAQTGPIRQLPQGVQFGPGRVGGECATAGFGAVNAHSLRFSRLGTWCDTTAGPGCRPEDSGAVNRFTNGATGTVICVTQPTRGLERAILVTPGGGTRTAP